MIAARRTARHPQCTAPSGGGPRTFRTPGGLSTTRRRSLVTPCLRRRDSGHSSPRSLIDEYMSGHGAEHATAEARRLLPRSREAVPIRSAPRTRTIDRQAVVPVNLMRAEAAGSPSSPCRLIHLHSSTGTERSCSRPRTAPSTRTAASVGFSCSHMRKTSQPASFSRAVVSPSRRRFVATFSAQKAALRLAEV